VKENAMGSPFPGMDPYLEGEMWQEFHERLANGISVQLMPRLAPKYVALLAKRYVLDRSLGIFDAPAKGSLYPDVHVVKPRRSASTPPAEGPSLALSEPAAELPNIEEVPQVAVEIRDIAHRRLVTLIEILSPANKYGEGSRDYEARRLDLLKTRTHILEIDLLRGGRRIQLAGEPPPGHYYVYLSRVERRPNAQVWAVDLRDRLPKVPVPLTGNDPDVPLDLQEAVDSCFRLVGYERLLDYSGPPPPPRLSPEDGAWLKEVLKSASRS
jgi:hypothetical protein